jgi:hypothetical protein
MTDTGDANIHDAARLARAEQAIRTMSGDLRAELDETPPPGAAVAQWLRDVTRQAPLQALAIAFVVGVMVARR